MIMTIDEGMNVDLQVKSIALPFGLSSLFTITERYSTCITVDATPILLPIYCSLLPSTVNKTPRYLKLLFLRK